MLFSKKKAPVEDAGAQTATEENPAKMPSAPPVAESGEAENIEYPKGIKLFLLIASVFVSLFLISLDRLIVATAIPAITNEFNSVTDIGWYGSAYLITNAAFQLMAGKVYTYWSVRGTFLSSIFLFEVGSAICGAAPNSMALIIARAIQGVGAAGLMAGTFTIIVYAVPLEKRPMYQGLVAMIFGLSSILGPLVGGAFTSNVSWRWCFYINLPFGAAAFVFCAFLLKIPNRPETEIPLKDKILQLDLLGSAALLPATVALLLALQWGGSSYAWSDGRIIALLTIAIALLIVFCLVQVYTPQTATIPPHIFSQRSVVAAVWCTICNGSSMLIFIYFIPLWFQAISGASAISSGILLLPMCLPMVFSAMVAGVGTTRFGYYTPFLIAGTCLMAIGAGLLTTLQSSTPDRLPIGFQVVYGLGTGLVLQAPNIAAQTVLSQKDSPVGLTLVMFTQLLAGAVFISVGQNVLNNRLLEYLAPIPGFSAKLLLKNGATTLIDVLGEQQKPAVLAAYNEALRWVFRVGLIVICLAMPGALAMEWKSVKKGKQGGKKEGVVDEKVIEEGKVASDSETERVNTESEKIEVKA